MVKIKLILKIKSIMTDYGKRSRIIEQKQANCGAVLRQKGAVPRRLLQIKAGVMFKK